MDTAMSTDMTTERMRLQVLSARDARTLLPALSALALREFVRLVIVNHFPNTADNGPFVPAAQAQRARLPFAIPSQMAAAHPLRSKKASSSTGRLLNVKYT